VPKYHSKSYRSDQPTLGVRWASLNSRLGGQAETLSRFPRSAPTGSPQPPVVGRRLERETIEAKEYRDEYHDAGDGHDDEDYNGGGGHLDCFRVERGGRMTLDFLVIVDRRRVNFAFLKYLKKASRDESRSLGACENVASSKRESGTLSLAQCDAVRRKYQ